MISLPVKLIVALTCFTAVYLSTEAVDAVSATTTSCIPGLPGRDGRDGQPGHDGRDGAARPVRFDGCDGLPGPPERATCTEQLKEYIEMLQEELRTLSCCKTSCTPQCAGTTADNPATSCKEIHDCDTTVPSGYYWVNTTTGPLQVYCQMETYNCGDITGGWMRAAYIDMTNVSNTCPQGLTYTVASSTRMCTRSHSGTFDCSSVTFPTHGVPYTRVCGRARGYQYWSTNAFYSYHAAGQITLDSSYVSGLSVTYGSPRNHIWTFAVGRSKDTSYRSNCPCDTSPGHAAPPFVGENYSCESGNTGQSEGQWSLTDPVWDSQGCASGSICCDRGGPWFTTTLSQEVRDDIEMRICHTNYDVYEDIGVDQLEIFIY